MAPAKTDQHPMAQQQETKKAAAKGRGIGTMLLGGCAAVPAVLGVAIAYTANFLTPIAPKPVLDDAVFVPLEKNTDLVQAEHLFEDVMYAPEDIVVDDEGTMYMGLGTGEIVRMKPGAKTYETWVRTGEDLPECGELAAEPRCGRPLGLEWADAAPFKRVFEVLDKEGADDYRRHKQVLLVLDAYKGILMVTKQGKIYTLFTEADGRKLVFPNSVAVASDGMVYITDSTSRWQRNRVILEVLEADTIGRLVKFDPRKFGSPKAATTKVDNLPFPNGCVLTKDEKHILVNILTRYKVAKISISESPQEMVEFAALPGMPDNIAYGNLGGKYGEVLLVGAAAPRPPGLYGKLLRQPWLRAFVASLPAHIALKAVKKYGMVIVLSLDGKILRVLQDPTGRSPYIAGGVVVGEHLYLGSWKNRFLTRVPLAELPPPGA